MLLLPQLRIQIRYSLFRCVVCHVCSVLDGISRTYVLADLAAFSLSINCDVPRPRMAGVLAEAMMAVDFPFQLSWSFRRIAFSTVGLYAHDVMQAIESSHFHIVTSSIEGRAHG